MNIISLVNYIFGSVNFVLKHLGDILLFAILIVAIYYAYKIFKWFKRTRKIMKVGGIVNQ